MTMLNINYFKTIDTEVKAYFLGYLVADGSISKTTNRVSFTINSKDDYILEAFKKDINSENRVRRYKVFDKRTNKTYNSSAFQISSKIIKHDLSKLGISSHKTFVFNGVNNLPNHLFPHFLRGLFDGDGYINEEKPTISLISTKEFIDKLNDKLFYKPLLPYALKKENNVYRVHIQNRETCIDFLNYIYNDSSIFLKRKYGKYIRLFQSCDSRRTVFREKEVLIKNRMGEIINTFKSLLDCGKYYNIHPSTVCNLIRSGRCRQGVTFHRGDMTVIKNNYVGESNFIKQN